LNAANVDGKGFLGVDAWTWIGELSTTDID
jgi:hypothetical protein